MFRRIPGNRMKLTNICRAAWGALTDDPVFGVYAGRACRITEGFRIFLIVDLNVTAG